MWVFKRFVFVKYGVGVWIIRLWGICIEFYLSCFLKKRGFDFCFYGVNSSVETVE